MTGGTGVLRGAATRWIGAAAAFALGACAATTAQSIAGSSGNVAAAKSVKAAASVEPAGGAAGVATVVHLADAPRRQVGGGKAQISMLARGNNAFVGKLEMKANGKVPEHRDATEEYIHVLAGGGTIYIEDKPSTLRAGSTVFMPANAKVRFDNGPTPLVALQIFAGPAPAAKYNKWQPVTAGAKASADE
jgi:quercetin dioxygenase-like cupin family protein